MNEEASSWISRFEVGDKVDKVVGYSFPGTVVARFSTTTGKIRYVVEMDDHHILHIFNDSQLRRR